MRASSSGLVYGLVYSRFAVTPTFSRRSCCSFTCSLMAACPVSIAFSRPASSHSLPSPSTIIMLVAVAATIILMSASANSVRVGFTLYAPLMRATRTSEITSWIGMSDTASAADAARQASASGITSSSEEISDTSTCTSHR